MADFDDVVWENGEENGDDSVIKIAEPVTSIFNPKKKAINKPVPKLKISFQADDYEVCLLRHQLDYEKQAKESFALTTKINKLQQVENKLLKLLPSNLARLVEDESKNLSNVKELIDWFTSTFNINDEQTVVNDKTTSIPSVTNAKFHLVLDHKEGSPTELSQLFLCLLNALQFLTRYVTIIDPVSYSPQDHDDVCQERKTIQLNTMKQSNSSRSSSSRHGCSSVSSNSITGSSSSSTSSVNPVNLIEENSKNGSTHDKNSVGWIEVYVNIDKSEESSKKSSKKSKKSTELRNNDEDNFQWVNIDVVHNVVNDVMHVKSRLSKGQKLDYILAVDSLGYMSDVTLKYNVNLCHTHMRVQDKHSKEYMTTWVKNYITAHNESRNKLLVKKGDVIDLIDDNDINTTSSSSNNQSSKNKNNRKAAVAIIDVDDKNEAKRQKLEHLRQLESEHMTQLDNKVLTTMPSSVKDFKDHPYYLLERHLLSDQMLHPTNKKIVGTFNNENVYLQAHKEKLKSFIQWRREARLVRRGEEPAKVITRLKLSKTNNNTDKKRKSVDMEGDNNHDDIDFELDEEDLTTTSTDNSKTINIKLYGLWQTDPLCAGSVEDGVIPINEHGNIEVWEGKSVFVPDGAVFIEGSMALKAAKNINIYHVPALTGFEARRGGKFNVPVLGGVVVLCEHEQLVKEAVNDLTAAEEQKYFEKREKLIVERWKKLVKAAVVRQKLREKYGH